MRTGFASTAVLMAVPFLFASAQAVCPPPKPPFHPWPGYGWGGTLETYETTPELSVRMARYGLTAGWYNRNDLPRWPGPHYGFSTNACPVNRLPYLLYCPRRAKDPVPLILYFGGTGEHGTNLVGQFRQSTVFEIVAGTDFQKRHPSYLLAPMMPQGGSILTIPPEWPTNLSALVNDAMYAVIASLSDPPVDTNRLYVTGLSWGGCAAFSQCSGYPGRFAAALPIAAYHPASLIATNHPGNYWLVCNEAEVSSPEMKEAIQRLSQTVRSRGGDFRFSTYPDTGHDAWSKAWREPALWDWLFSKTADGRPVGAKLSPLTGKPVKGPDPAPSTADVSATAFQPASDESHGPERAGDGLDGTWYASASPRRRGDWLQLEWSAPQSGRVTVATGTPDGKFLLSNAHVELSRNGRVWSRMAGFSRDTGLCRFTAREPFRFLRVLVDADAAAPLVVREAHIE